MHATTTAGDPVTGPWILVAMVSALVVTAIATPMAGRLALALDVVDRPNDRKVNRRSGIPLLGGLSIALGCFVGFGVALLLVEEGGEFATRVEAILMGGALMLSLGAVDDRWGLGAIPKLVVQIVAAAVAISAGFQIDHISHPFSHVTWYFPNWVMWLVTTLWIVVVTNSVNLIDGLDGLCTGVSAIIAATLTLIAWSVGLPFGVVTGTVLVGALLGFLPFNFPPARIFVGDTGALFIGYCLSLLALETYSRATLITFIIPLLALAVPLIDTGLSVLRRLRRREHILKADRLHIHHRLLSEYEGSHRQAVLSLYFLTGCFCIIAVSFTRLQGNAALVFLIVIALLTLRILRNLGFFEVEDDEVGAPALQAADGGAPREGEAQ